MAFDISLLGQVDFDIDFGGIAPSGGEIKVWTGASWELKPVKVYNGSIWETKPLKRWTGATWIET